MSNRDTVIKLMTELELQGANKVSREIKKLAKEAKITMNPSEWVQIKKRSKEAFTESFQSAIQAGLSADNLKGLTTTYAKLMTRVRRAQVEGASEASKIYTRELERRFRAEMKHVERLNKRRTDALKEAERFTDKLRSEIVEDFSKGLSGALGDLQGGNLSNVIKGLSGSVKALGGAALGASQHRDDKMGKLLKNVGEFLVKAGPAIMAFGALAGSLGIFVKMVLDADGKMKELNRTLIDSGIAGAELSDEMGGATESINKLRKAFTSDHGAFAFNRIWGTTASDHLQILGAYAQSGRTFERLTRDAKDAREEIEKLRDATQSAIAYAKLLGTSSQEMGGNIGSYMEDLGAEINYVQESLSAVATAARDSGTGVKRFYGLLLQATSGMSMYNVRLEEAGGLLIRLGKVLGVKTGGEFLSQLTRGFMGESMQDRYKRTMLTPGMDKIFGRTATSTSQDFLSKLSGLGGTERGIFEQALSAAGITSRGAGGFTKQAGGLSPSVKAKLMAEARLSGNDDLVRILGTVIGAAQGARGGTGNMARNLGTLDMGGKLLAMLQQGQNVIGTPLHKMGTTQLMAFESMTGISGEQLEYLKRISESMSGNWQMLRDMKALSDEELKIVAKAYGAVPTDGGIRSARVGSDGVVVLGEKLDTVADYIQLQGDVFRQAAKDGVPADIQLAQDIVSNTTEMTKILEQGVEWWLEQIYGVTESILGLFINRDEAGYRQEALNDIAKEMRESRKAIREEQKDIAKMRAEMRVETAAGKETLREKIEVSQAKIKRLEGGLEQSMLARSSILSDPAKARWFFEGGEARSKEDFLHAARSGGEVESLRKRQLSAIDDSVRKSMIERGANAYADRVMREYFGESDMQVWMKRREGPGKRYTGAPIALDQFEAFRELSLRMGRKAMEAKATGTHASMGDLVRDKEWWAPNIRGMSVKGSRLGTSHGINEERAAAMRRALEDVDLDRFVDQADKLQVEKIRQEEKLHTTSGPRAQARELRKALEAMQTEDIAGRIQSVLAQAGVDIDSSTSMAYSNALKSGEIPNDLRKHLNRETSMPFGAGRTTVGQRFSEMGMPIANDFLAVFDSQGRTKLSQRINTRDELALLATKSDGVVRGSRRGEGGVVIHYHEYNNVKGWSDNQAKLRRVLSGRVG